MKKFIAMLLIIVMVMSMSVSAAASNLSDIKGVENESAIETLVNLGVIDGYPDGTYKPEANVTRAHMAALIIRALGYGDIVYQTNTIFTDVPSSHWASGFIAFASNMGIIEGYGNNLFGPDDNVTYDQAITMVIRGLGYEEGALRGTYPTAFTYKAYDLGIMNGIKTGTAHANRGEIAQLLYNALSTEIVITSFSPVFNVYQISSTGETILHRLGAKVTEEILTYADAAAINAINKVGEFSKVYRDQHGNIIAATSLADTLVGEWENGKFIVDGKGYTIKNSVYDVEPMACINGELNLLDMDDIEEYNILNCDVSGNYITNIYSASKWIGETFQATKNTINSIEKNRLNSYDFITDANEIDMNSFILNGVESLDDIIVGDIITVFTYGNGTTDEIIRIDIASAIISGVVSKVKTSDGVVLYTINGKTFEMVSGTLTIGVEYKCYLNAEGKIFKADRLASSDAKIGIYSKKDTDTFNGTQIGFYTYDNMNSLTIKYIEDIDINLNPGDMFIYTTNRNGDINTIEKANVGTIRIIGSIAHINGDGSKIYRIAKDVMVFTDNDISIINKVDNRIDIENAQFIYDDDNTILAMYIPIAHADASTGTGYCVINDWATVATSKGTVLELDVYIDGVHDVINTVSTNPIVGDGELNTSNLYKANFSGEDIKTLTLITPDVSTVKIDDDSYDLIQGENNTWYMLNENVIIYEKTENGFKVRDSIPDEVNVYLYDTDKEADEIYDIVIFCE